MVKKLKIAELRRQARVHGEAKVLAHMAGEAMAEAYHLAQWERLRAEIMARDTRGYNRPETPVSRARDARWQHFGTMGRVRHAMGAIGRIQRLPTATPEAQAAAAATYIQLMRLLQLLNTRKQP